MSNRRQESVCTGGKCKNKCNPAKSREDTECMLLPGGRVEQLMRETFHSLKGVPCTQITNQCYVSYKGGASYTDRQLRGQLLLLNCIDSVGNWTVSSSLHC